MGGVALDGGGRWLLVGLFLTASCTVPPMNVGRPVEVGRSAATVAAGQTFGNARYTNDVYDPEDLTPPYRDRTRTPEGIGLPASTTVGFRYGLLPAIDFGIEASFGHVGVSTRVAPIETSAVDVVVTGDARVLLGPAYDFTGRILAFVPLASEKQSSLLLGGGVSGGMFRHQTWHEGWLLRLEFVKRRELRAEALAGITFRSETGRETTPLVDVFFIPKAGPSDRHDYTQTFGFMLAIATTLPLESSNESGAR